MRFLTSSSWIAAHSQTLRLLALSLSYAASLLIFQQGLLVKRQVLPQRSACCSSDSVVAFDTKHKHCWLPPRFNKTVLLIVDALRYDFIFPYDNYKGRLHPLPNSHYHRQMTKVAQLMREQPANSALFPFIADAPTTTFQRIKALVTGSVPAFIEAGENFGGTEISEDNIVDQLVAKGGNATLLGDETWIQLLPGRFHRHFEEPSFDIKDLDRVDDTVIAHIYHELARPDWTLLVAHCLGVDHAGHRYGPDHPEMSRKLRQMDSLIWELTRRLSEDTILLVLGDHGMTASGDHGGDSHQELVSALFAYTRQPGGFDAPAENNDGTSSTAEKGNDGGGGTREGGEKPVKAVKQVDLVPTLAFLLDLPIPFSNIGQFIFPLFSGNLLQEIRLNTVQMLRYAQEYAKHKPELREQLRQIVREHESSLNDFEANRQTIQALQSLIRRSLDSQFQWTVCFLGLLSLLDALMFNCYLLAAGPDECLSICLWVFRSALLLLQLSLIFAQQPSTDQVLFSVASLLLSLSYQVPACLAKLVRSSQSAANIHNNLLSLLVIGGGQLVLAILPFSNSFIIYEADVLRFAIQSLVLIVTVRLLHLYRITSIWQMPQQLSDMLMRSVFILVFLRVMRPFESCREEQVECIDYKSAESQLFLHCLLVSFGCAYLQLEYFWPATGDDGHNANDNGVHLTTRAFVWPMTALLCLHWLFELSAQSMQAGRLVEDEKRSAAIASTVATLELCSRVLGQLIFGILILHHLTLRWRNENDETGDNSDDNKTKEASITTVCRRRRNGRLQAQFQALSVPLMMLVGPAQAWKLALLLTMFPMAEQLFCIEKVWTRAWLLHLLGAYAFFGTGNQQTLSSIPWRAAFVALPGNFPYKWLPALLVLSSMFAGGVVASLMVLRDETGGMAPLYFMLFGGLKVFGCSAASLLHHRHLMFYKVFAPKFVFESVEFLFTCAFIVVWVCLFRRTGRHTVLDK